MVRLCLLPFLLIFSTQASALTFKSGETISSSLHNESQETAPIGDRPTPSADLMRDAACTAFEDGTAKQLQDDDHKD